MATGEEEDIMTNQEFFKALDYDDGLSVVTEVWAEFCSFAPALPARTYRLENQFD